MRYYVEINGESSLDIQGLMIQSLPSISKPLMRSKQETIDGRDGDIITKLGYSAYDKTLKIGLWGNYDINEVIAFFNQEGVITFSNEPDKYYNFTILNRDDYVSQLDKFRTCTIALHCQPYKYKLNEEAGKIENEYVEETGTCLTFNNSLVAPMNIDLKGNTSQTGTPTPTTPIPVNVVSGDNDVEICGKNLFDGVFELGDIDTTTGENHSNNSRIRTKNYIIIEPETTYTLSTDTQNGRWGVFYDKNKNFLSRISLDITGNNTSKTFTSVANAYYIRWYLINNTSLNVKEQLQLGSTATTYEAYNGATYHIDLPVENLFNPVITNNENDIYTNNCSVSTNNGVLTITATSNGYLTFGVGRGAGGEYQNDRGVKIYVKQNTNYKLSFSNNSFASVNITEYNSSNISLGVKNMSLSSVYTPSANTSYVSLGIYMDNAVGGTSYSTTIQFEEGSKANSYTPYGTTPIELCKIGTYQDYFYKDSGKWYKHSEIGKVVLNGSDGGTGWLKFGGMFYIDNALNDYKKVNGTTCISNYYKGANNSSTTQGSYDNGNNTLSLRLGDDLNRILIRNDDIDTSQNFATWLSTHNTILYFVLATSTNTEITYTPLINQLDAILEAQSKKGTTNITQVNNDLPFIITASVLSGTDSITLTNEGNTTSKPNLTITGSGVVGVYLENIQMFNISLGTNETIIIDTENMEAYYGSQLKNRQVTGDYSNFALQSGTNNLKFTGAVTNVEITNYNRWI